MARKQLTPQERIQRAKDMLAKAEAAALADQYSSDPAFEAATVFLTSERAKRVQAGSTLSTKGPSSGFVRLLGNFLKNARDEAKIELAKVEQATLDARIAHVEAAMAVALDDLQNGGSSADAGDRLAVAIGETQEIEIGTYAEAHADYSEADAQYSRFKEAKSANTLRVTESLEWDTEGEIEASA